MIPQAYLYICDGDIDNPVLTHKKMDWPEKYPHWQEIPLVMALKQEPVKVMGFNCVCGRRMVVESENGVVASPPKREWQGLTEDEGKAIAGWQIAGYRPIKEVINAIEAKLKEKNT